MDRRTAAPSGSEAQCAEQRGKNGKTRQLETGGGASISPRPSNHQTQEVTPMTERTFSIIKPDATRRNLTGKVNAVIEDAGLRIVAQRSIQKKVVKS